METIIFGKVLESCGAIEPFDQRGRDSRVSEAYDISSNTLVSDYPGVLRKKLSAKAVCTIRQTTYPVFWCNLYRVRLGRFGLGGSHAGKTSARVTPTSSTRVRLTISDRILLGHRCTTGTSLSSLTLRPASRRVVRARTRPSTRNKRFSLARITAAFARPPIVTVGHGECEGDILIPGGSGRLGKRRGERALHIRADRASRTSLSNGARNVTFLTKKIREKAYPLQKQRALNRQC
jgi:hypothetical protein